MAPGEGRHEVQWGRFLGVSHECYTKSLKLRVFGLLFTHRVMAGARGHGPCGCICSWRSSERQRRHSGDGHARCYLSCRKKRMMCAPSPSYLTFLGPSGRHGAGLASPGTVPNCAAQSPNESLWGRIEKRPLSLLPRSSDLAGVDHVTSLFYRRISKLICRGGSSVVQAPCMATKEIVTTEARDKNVWQHIHGWESGLRSRMPPHVRKAWHAAILGEESPCRCGDSRSTGL